MAWDMPSAEPGLPAAAPQCDGKLGMQGWRKLVLGPRGPQEEGLEEEMLTEWRTRVQVCLEAASLQVW